MSLHPRDFDPRDPRSLRLAVEHLRTIEPAKYTGIMVEAPVKAGMFKLRAPGFLKLEQIVGRTPAEVWELFDQQVDQQISYFMHR
jgi:hypothetical protein